MINRNDYFYKGFDIDSKSKMEHKEMELLNPYGYNFESNKRRVTNKLVNYKTNQDNIFPIKSTKK